MSAGTTHWSTSSWRCAFATSEGVRVVGMVEPVAYPLGLARMRFDHPGSTCRTSQALEDRHGPAPLSPRAAAGRRAR